ncbi:MAG: transposase [Bacteroidales bacterium]|nr:transposase [Bacteroidales bacterium]
MEEKKIKRRIFPGIINPENFFTSEENCLEYIAQEKWKGGFVCRKCGHTNYCKGRKPASRRCTRCKTEESATAHTIFHHCRIPLAEAFRIVYLVCNDPEISSYEISRELDRRQMTCWKFKKKVMECIEEKGEFGILTGDHEGAQ